MSLQSSEIKFAYWVPNVSGGLVVSTIEQRTDWSYDYNIRLAQTAEKMVSNMHSLKSVLLRAMVQKISMNR
jgi:hypothetical protein